jgi:hypothetical protein
VRTVIVTRGTARPGRRAVEQAPPARLEAVLNTLAPGDLLYLDLSAFTAAAARATLKKLLAREGLFLGVVDPGGTVKDVPALFHDGAVDYLDAAAWKAGILPRRLNRVAAYTRALRRFPEDVVRESPPACAGRPSGADFSRLQEGEDYTFSLLFMDEALASFRAYVDRSVAPFAGRTWIWSRFGGIVLFPFDGRREQAAPCGLSMILYKHLYDIEESRFPHFVSWRMAAHLGEVTWRERATGTLVSDTLNSVFHLGQQFAPPGSFLVTDDVRDLAGVPLRAFFLPVENYEGRRIWRMRRPLSP